MPQLLTVAQLVALAESPQVARWADLAARYAWGTGIRPELVLVRIAVETRGDPSVVSSADERGLLQLSPDTRARYCVGDAEAHSPETNIRVGMRLWSSWAAPYLASDHLQPVERQGIAWLTTAIGPAGTQAALRLVAGSPSPLFDLTRLAEITPTVFVGAYGKQSPELVAHRIRVAHNAALAAATMEQTPMSTTHVALFAALVAAAAVVAYFYGPRRGWSSK